MQNWDEVRLGLMALGYRRVLTVEIVCITHGTFRGAIEDEALRDALARLGASVGTNRPKSIK